MPLIFLGAPGSGKGTQSERLKKTHGYSHISTGDLLRAEVSSGTELGGRIKNIIDNGSLVDDMTVLELFKNNLQLDEKNYILDGFPRTINQCEMLSSEVFGDIAHKAIYFEIDERKVVERIVNRRVAPQSGEIYNLVTNPPKVDGVCDVSGEKLVHRDDDKEEVDEASDFPNYRADYVKDVAHSAEKIKGGLNESYDAAARFKKLANIK